MASLVAADLAVVISLFTVDLAVMALLFTIDLSVMASLVTVNCKVLEGNFVLKQCHRKKEKRSVRFYDDGKELQYPEN